MIVAIILTCMATLSPDACTRATALDVQIIPVQSLQDCMMAGQGVPARDGLAEGTFVKTMCAKRGKP